jgi:hypothetical protein
MFKRFTIREFGQMILTAILTAAVMYTAWQADRAVLALRLSQMQYRVHTAEDQKMPQLEIGQTMVITRDGKGKYRIGISPAVPNNPGPELRPVPGNSDYQFPPPRPSFRIWSEDDR